MKNTEATPTTTHIPMLTRRNGWGVQCWTCGYTVKINGYKADAERVRDQHKAEAK